MLSRKFDTFRSNYPSAVRVSIMIHERKACNGGFFGKLNWGWMALIPVLILFPVNAISGDSLVIQENAPGVCTMDGIVETDQPGYTGEGYANIDNGMNIGMSWSFSASTAGSCKILWRFALGGSDATSRDAGLFVNNVLIDTIVFSHSDSQSWAEWKFTDTASINIVEGVNTIRLGSITPKGLANIDYVVIFGTELTPAECLPAYTLSVVPNNPLFGAISYNPELELYDSGTHVTVYADENAGYFFHSWSGEESGIQDTFSFNISRNTHLTALFYENGTEMAEGASGYATVQHDNGTPYLLTGGSEGSTVEPENVEDLKAFLTADEPYVIRISKHFKGEGEIKVNSNKTLIGTNDTAHIEGMMMSIASVRNIIIQNVSFSRVVTMDEMELNGARNIWIDHCEFFTDRDHDKDYYDGLLDIKNESSFITVSWCNFHDHYKSILISSGDDSYQDSVQRITFHHNYFHDCGSRLPSIRFGKAHIFSNFFENNGSAINTRVGACVKVEHNYFLNSGSSIMQTGTAYLDMDPATNIFINSTVQTGIPGCNLNVPYPYEELIDSASLLPLLIPSNVRMTDVAPSSLPGYNGQITQVRLYPNPAADQITVEFHLYHAASVKIEMYNMLGVKVMQLVNDAYSEAGSKKLTIPMKELKPGLYVLHLHVGNQILHRKIIRE